MPSANDIALYEEVKNEARKRFKTWPSAYASAWLVQEYTKRGGTFAQQRGARDGVGRWFDEQWVQVIPYVKDGKIVACGASNKQTKACRPLRRINEKTPATIDELVSLHGKRKLLQLASRKNRDMAGRLYWSRGKQSTPRKQSAKKATPRKQSAKKATPRKQSAKRATPRKQSAKRATPRKQSSKRATPRKQSSKRATPRKQSAKRATPRKQSAKRATPRKQSSKKATPRKQSAKRATPRKQKTPTRIRLRRSKKSGKSGRSSLWTAPKSSSSTLVREVPKIIRSIKTKGACLSTLGDTVA